MRENAEGEILLVQFRGFQNDAGVVVAEVEGLFSLFERLRKSIHIMRCT